MRQYIAILICAAVLLLCAGCTYDPYTGFSIETPPENTEPEKYEDSDIDGVAETYGSGDFGYEKAAARLYYNKTADDISVADTYENLEKDNYGSYDFDDTGFGIFVVGLPEYSGAGSHGFYIEYTTDYGETWTVRDKGFYSPYYVAGVRTANGKVYIIRRSGGYMDSYVMYSDDHCRTFERIDPVSLLPQFEGRLEGMTTNLMLLTIDETDGSLVFAWDSEEECETAVIGDDPEFEFAWGHRKLFLIVKTDSELKKIEILYSDMKYIREREYEREHYE